MFPVNATRNDRCYLCGSPNATKISDHVRDIPSLGVLRCDECGLVYLESFAHLTPEYYRSAYNEANHAAETWEEHLRICAADDERRARDLAVVATNRSFLEVGCGGGGVLLRLKDLACAVAGVEPQDRWRDVLTKKGYRVFGEISDVPPASFDVIGSFHVLEHITDPIPFLRTLGEKLAPGGRLILEVPSAHDALLRLYERKAFADFTFWSAHAYLFSPSTLETLLRRADLKVLAVRQFQRFPLSNHLRWLAEGKPGGHVAWSFLDTPELTSAYAETLARQGMCDTLIAHAAR